MIIAAETTSHYLPFQSTSIFPKTGVATWAIGYINL